MNKHRFNLKGFVSSLLVLAMLFTTSIPAFAEQWIPPGANGTTGTSGDAFSPGTWSSENQGYRVSVITPTGEQVKPPMDFIFNKTPEGIIRAKENKFGHISTNTNSPITAPDGMPPPLKVTSTHILPNGDALRNWLVNADGGNLDHFVEEHFKIPKEDLAKYKVIFEPIYWFELQSRDVVTNPNGSKVTFTKKLGVKIYGTVTNINEFILANKNQLGAKWDSSSGTPKLTELTYGNMTLISGNAGALALITAFDDKELGINKATRTSGYATCEEVLTRANGLGLHIYSSEATDIPSTHTWDFPVQDPAPAPDPKDIPKLPEEKVDKTRVYNIVKTYRDRDSKDVITHVATYSRTKNPAMIEIEDEPDYKVKEWYTSTKYNKLPI